MPKKTTKRKTKKLRDPLPNEITASVSWTYNLDDVIAEMTEDAGCDEEGRTFSDQEILDYISEQFSEHLAMFSGECDFTDPHGQLVEA